MASIPHYVVTRFNNYIYLFLIKCHFNANSMFYLDFVICFSSIFLMQYEWKRPSLRVWYNFSDFTAYKMLIDEDLRTEKDSKCSCLQDRGEHAFICKHSST